MLRIIDLPIPVGWLRIISLGIAVLFLTGCAVSKTAWLAPGIPDREIERHRFPLQKGEDLIGRLAAVRLDQGDTLPDMARHFGLGINAISAANPGVDIWIPEPGERITLPMSFILPDAPRKGIVVNLATMRLFRFKENGEPLKVSTYPVGVGTRERPSPIGQMQVSRKAARPTWHVPASIAEDHRKKGDILPAKVLPGPENPLGEYALYLSKTGYLIHGTNKPASIGLKATNGCLRLYPENIAALYQETPVNTPVIIVNQPYLVGQRDGVLYLEAHAPQEGPGEGEWNRISAKLKAIEAQSARTLDWQKVRKVQAEARGIPVPILEMRQGAEKELGKPIEVEHPARLYGSPEVPKLQPGAWYVLAADLREEMDARRMAAIINHQGPPIPARVIPKSTEGTGYRVVAGPFDDASRANDAVKRLKLDLEIDGIVIDPARKI